MALADIQDANGVFIKTSSDYAIGIEAGKEEMRGKIISAVANHIEAERKGAEERFGVALDPDTYANEFSFTMEDLENIIANA